MRYRKEIDGLRAVAVIPVILQHAKFSFIPGGYVGVDVFFVISGFLISDIVYTAVLADRFSLLEFYERRARRILPALFLVIGVTAIVAHHSMLPNSYESFGQSVAATLLFSNNVLLTVTSGYWDLASDFKPLLHTWSLGVEEQFYIVYPLLLWGVNRYKPTWFLRVVSVLLLTSFVMSALLSINFPNSSFYLLHTRAWELLMGALSTHYRRTRSLPQRWAKGLAAFGVLLIIASMASIREGIPYPFVYALLPCLGGSLFLIFAVDSEGVGKWLGSAPLVGIGLISYSAYLWHQPLFALTRLARTSEPPSWLYGLLVVLTLLLAYLTWRYVELPFRDRQRFGRFGIVTASGCGLLAGGLYAVVVVVTHGLPQRAPDLGLTDEKYIAYNESAFRFKIDAFRDKSKKHLLVLGNSTGRDLINVIVESNRFSLYEIAYRDDINPCFPIVDGAKRDLVEQADQVVIATNWNFDGKCRRIAYDDSVLADKILTIVGPKHFGYNIDVYMRTPLQDRPLIRANLLPTTWADDAAYKALVRSGHYVDQLALMRERFGGVPIFDDSGRLLSVDRVHLTRAGAQYFAKFLFEDPAWRYMLKEF